MLQFLVWINANLYPVIHLYACMLSEIDCTFRKVGSQSQILSVSHQMVISQWHACWLLIDDNLIILRAPFLKNTLQRKCLAATGGSPLSSGISLCVAETDKENCISLDGGCPSFFVGNMEMEGRGHVLFLPPVTIETPHSFVDKQVSLPHSTHKVAFIDRHFFFSATCGGEWASYAWLPWCIVKGWMLSTYIRAHWRKFHMHVWFWLYIPLLFCHLQSQSSYVCPKKVWERPQLHEWAHIELGEYMCFFSYLYGSFMHGCFARIT